MTVDFHVHSTASDGTCSPSELTEKAKGFAAIALTDHDNCDGLEDWNGIPGIELSIEPGEGFDKFHLLGHNIFLFLQKYLFQPNLIYNLFLHRT